MKHDHRAPRVKKNNRALTVTRFVSRQLLVLGVLAGTSLAPLTSLAAHTDQPKKQNNFSEELIVDNNLAFADQSDSATIFDAAVSAPAILPSMETTVDDTQTTQLALSDTALVYSNPVETVKAPEPIIVEPDPAPVQVAVASNYSASSTNYSTNLAPDNTELSEPAANNGPRTELPPQRTKPPGPRYGPEKFDDGFCTDFVARYYDGGSGLAWYDNAGNWLYRAQQAGWSTGSTPDVGAIMVTSEGGGHVALVESVNYSNRTFTVREQNYIGLYIVSTRTVSFDASFIKGFIY